MNNDFLLPSTPSHQQMRNREHWRDTFKVLAEYINVIERRAERTDF